MIKVYQTKYGEKKGNCFQACVASIFELPLDDVPDFCHYEPIEEWYEYFLSWLREHGFSSIELKVRDDLNRDSYKDCFLIVNGKNCNGVLHAVIYKNGELIHNPNEYSNGIEPNAVYIIFPLVPRLEN